MKKTKKTCDCDGTMIPSHGKKGNPTWKCTNCGFSHVRETK